MGYIGYIRYATDDRAEPETPWVICVSEEAGSIADVLTTCGGESTYKRFGLTVFATETETEEDACRRIQEAELIGRLYTEAKASAGVIESCARRFGWFG